MNLLLFGRLKREPLAVRKLSKRGKNLDIVQFTTIEENDDLVLSFSFKEGTEFGIDGFCIQRTPKLEFALDVHERGASIDWTEDDEVILVKKVELSRREIKINSQYEQYIFDVSKLPDEEYSDIIKILKKMNFDNKFELIIQERT